MKIYYFIDHAKASFLDLQFVFSNIYLNTATIEVKNIQKTIIFVNNVTDIKPMISIFWD